MSTSRLKQIKLLHTVIWAFFASLIFYILYAGLYNDIDSFTWIAIGLVTGEAITLLLFKWRCPLTLIARGYSDSTKENFDIYLPEWLAKHKKLIFTTLFVAGVVLVLVRWFQ